MTTEAEAKAQPCIGPAPHITGVAVSGWQGRDHHGVRVYRCRGSACLAWRWTLERLRHGNGLSRLVASKTDGYCGLAGKP